MTLRGDELPGLVDVALHSDAIVLAVQAAAPQLHEIALDPPLRARARFGLVTLAGRSAAPALALLRQAVRDYLHD